MRLWHYKLLPYLPDAQFKGQLRELVAIMHDWRDKGATNHILINRVTEYPRADLYSYFLEYAVEYQIRNDDRLPKCTEEFRQFAGAQTGTIRENPFPGWHNKAYLRVCMANLYEKHVYGRGKSQITDAEWNRLKAGYYYITGDVYEI